MNNKIKNIITVILFGAVVLSFSLMAIFGEKKKYTESERRALEAFPEVSAKTIFSGDFSSDFEKYATDNFPFRDYFRGIKNFSELYLFGKEDTNGLYIKDGHISKLEYPENEKMVNNAAEKITDIYETYLSGKAENIYVSVIPDKGKFLAEDKLSLDYEGFEERFVSKIPFAKHIKISHLLKADDYYKTDSHWKQEKITGIARYIAEKMGAEGTRIKYNVKTLEKPFYGVYAGQSALPCDADEMRYLTNETLEKAVVKYYDTGLPKEGGMYDMKKADGKDPYEMFLSGSMPLITIENTDLEDGKELIIFRDSFGSSIAPLLSLKYRKTTVIDIRYVQSDFLGNLVDFSNKDVLFLYSTTMLNNSNVLR